MMRLLEWLFNLFDSRTEYEKQREEKLVKDIIKLNKTHQIVVGKRGSIQIVKREVK